MSLPVALQPLQAYQQFIVYTTRPSPTRPGKLDKLPVDWRTGQVANAQDPNIWTTYENAYEYGHGMVGFVFTDLDPFWFLDIDDCLTPSGWGPLALEICDLLKGAACEVSISGKGLHLFGTGKVPKHSCRGPSGTGLELYHTGRFVALGGNQNVIGIATHDCTDGLAKVVAKYFARGEESTPAEWTTEPEPGSGIPDDDDLIRVACNSKSASGVFGAKATFQQIWDADIAALSQVFPDVGGGRPYDGSSVDAALAQHLAFWTGKDCERIKRLMLKSGLVRDKWQRDDYLPRTILAAVGRQIDVYKPKPIDIIKPDGKIRDVEGSRVLNVEAQKILFHNCCYVSGINAIITPHGHIFSPEVFDRMFGGYTFVISNDNQKMSQSATDAMTKSQVVVFPKAHSLDFRPDKAVGEIWTDGNTIKVNSYWPIPVPAKKGNPRPFTDHIARILPVERDREIVLAYMAAIVQHPGVKFPWVPLVQGVQGNGKTLLSWCVVNAIGRDHCYAPSAAQLTDKFNDWLDGKIFVMVEDIYVPQERREIMEALKPMITSHWQEVQGKGKAKATRHICANFILNANNRDALRLTKDDRRFATFYTAQQTVEDLKRDRMDGDYFPNLYGWLNRDGYAIVTDYLMSYPIPDELNPAKSCHRAPITSSTTESFAEGMGAIEQEIQGAILEDRVGFRNGWISTHFFDVLIKDCGGHRIARNKRGAILKDMGYVPHPGLKDGQVNNAVSPDMMKPRLFVTANHYSLGYVGAGVAKAYELDQQDKNPALKMVC